MSKSFTVGKKADVVPPQNREGFSTMSRVHLSVSPTDEPGFYRLVDLGSTNRSYYWDSRLGVWSSFERIRVSEEVPLRLGSYEITVAEILQLQKSGGGNQTVHGCVTITPANMPGTFHVALSDPRMGVTCRRSESEAWTSADGKTLRENAFLCMDGATYTLLQLLQSCRPFRNEWGEICYRINL